MWINEDWERESDKDFLYALEREKDIEAALWAEYDNKPIKITYENIPRNKSFRKFSKRLLLVRSHFLTEAYRAEIGHIFYIRGEHESLGITPRLDTQGADY